MPFINYKNDFGVVYYTVPFVFNISENNNTVDQYTLTELVPALLLADLIELGAIAKGCPLPSDIIYRRVRVVADDNNIYTFMFPYNFSDTNFTGCIAQLQASAIVKEFTVIGEKIKFNKLNHILGINGF